MIKIDALRKETTSKKVRFWAFLAFVFLIPISSFISVRLLFLLLIVSLFLHKKNNLIKPTWDIGIYLLVLIGGLVYTTNKEMGFRVLETNFSFIAIPIIFSSIDSSFHNRKQETFYAFIAGLILTCCICICNATVLYIISGDTQFFFFYKLTDIIGLQPTYLAYYLIFAITFGLYLLYYKKSNINPIIILIVLLFFFFILILSGGRTAFISMLFIFSFFILKFLIDLKSKTTKLTFVGVVMMLTCMLVVSTTEQIDRGVVLNDSWERFVLWESAIKAIPDILLGVGTGDYKEVLNNYYRSHDLIEFANDSYNSHNQFIQILLTNGIFGLISILILICRPIYLSIKSQDILGVLVFFPFLIYGITEVFLGRYQGLVFFVFLHQVFISYYYSSENSMNRVLIKEV